MSEKLKEKRIARNRLYEGLCEQVERFVRRNAEAYGEMVQEACETAEWHLSSAIDKLREESGLPHRVAESLVSDQFNGVALVGRRSIEPEEIDRLVEVLDEGNQAAFAGRIGVTPQRLNKWLKGVCQPSGAVRDQLIGMVEALREE